ncbi:MAG: 23S rRNA (guanosine(2251)-2'-O)-methyltransferase RlmB, partial [Bacilli bacterium]
MYIYGKNTIKGYIENNKMLEEVLISKEFSDQKFLAYLKQKRVKYQFMNNKELDQLSEQGNHQGVVGKVFNYQYQTLEHVIKKVSLQQKSTIVVLDGLEDPQNFGSIIRSCEACGVDAIIIPKKRSVKVSPVVAKVSTGALENMDIVQVSNIKQAINSLKEVGYWSVAADMSASINYDEMDYDAKVVLVIGSEGFGVSSSVLKNSDYLVKIPMYGQVSSLN